ncbi:hypothetical protein QQX98_000902 [Neonectria punicea]|uniref:NB-ARC domain-containing protein n=1 Tax=Neonectria punicea TaxID=979145 RepID=A0ABR1HRU5_9HYPO
MVCLLFKTHYEPSSSVRRTDQMQADHEERHLGLRQVAPTDDDTKTTLDIVAIHGLETQSSRTWQFKRKPAQGGGVVHWLANSHMLPTAIPESRIFTYDWNSSSFRDAPVQTLRGHADTLLSHLADLRGTRRRPIIFVASCFGGLMLAEAVNRAARQGSAYSNILASIVGIVFLATPFRGSDAAKQAEWQIVVGGILGNETSHELVDNLNSQDKELRKLTQSFAEIAGSEQFQIPVRCFYETRKSELLRKYLSPGSATRVTTLFKEKTQKILVSESSACLDTFERRGLEATHSGMNKFHSPEDTNFQQVRETIKMFADKACTVIKSRQPAPPLRHFLIPFGQNKGFVGRQTILKDLLRMAPPDSDTSDCQYTAIEGLGGVGKTQIALETVYQIHEKHPDCSIFWVPAISATSFENAYRKIGTQLGIPGLDIDQADVKTLVKAALSQEATGPWLLVIDNADDRKLIFSDPGLRDYLPFSRRGSILFTTRNHEVTTDLDIPRTNVVSVVEMTRGEAMELLTSGLNESQTRDTESTNSLLDFLADLPLAIRQASSYMAKTGMPSTKYLHYCESSNGTMIKLLSRDFEDRYRYKETVATAWPISFKQISRDSPLAADYLRFSCFLAEKNIPISILPQCEDELEEEEAIGILKAYAFISSSQESRSFDIHRLVRLAMRNWMGEKSEWKKWATKTIQHLAEVFPSPEHETRQVWMEYLPHAQTALEHEQECASADANGVLLFNVAKSNKILGKYNVSVEMYQRSLEILQRTSGKEHPHTLVAMHNLADALVLQGDYNAAEQMHRENLEIEERIMGPEHQMTLGSMKNLSDTLRVLGKYNEAEQMSRKALEIQERILGPEHPSTLRSLMSLGVTLNKQGKYKTAEQIYRETLEIQERILGPENPATLFNLTNLAITLKNQNKYDTAEQILRETLDTQVRILGPDHPHTMYTAKYLEITLTLHEQYNTADSAGRLGRMEIDKSSGEL